MRNQLDQEDYVKLRFYYIVRGLFVCVICFLFVWNIAQFGSVLPLRRMPVPQEDKHCTSSTAHTGYIIRSAGPQSTACFCFMYGAMQREHRCTLFLISR